MGAADLPLTALRIGGGYNITCDHCIECVGVNVPYICNYARISHPAYKPTPIPMAKNLAKIK